MIFLLYYHSLNFPACSLPDTFQSWFLIAHLHVWLCLVRLKREGKDGSLVIREVVTTFWYDVEQRMRVLGVSCVRLTEMAGLRKLVIVQPIDNRNIGDGFE